METINLSTSKNNEFINITSNIEVIVRKQKIKQGYCCIFCPHTTAALTINENADPSVVKDIINYLKKIVPPNENFSHSEGNSDAHIKSSLLGNFLYLLIEDSQLVLGTWQAVYFCEFDGPRSRKIQVKIIGE